MKESKNIHKLLRVIQIVSMLASVVFIVLAIVIDREDTLYLAIALGCTLPANLITIFTHRKATIRNTKD